jgi:hypothetical protein
MERGRASSANVDASQFDRGPVNPRHVNNCLGELVQIDGLGHDWFEVRGLTAAA